MRTILGWLARACVPSSFPVHKTVLKPRYTRVQYDHFSVWGKERGASCKPAMCNVNPNDGLTRRCWRRKERWRRKKQLAGWRQKAVLVCTSSTVQVERRREIAKPSVPTTRTHSSSFISNIPRECWRRPSTGHSMSKTTWHPRPVPKIFRRSLQCQ